MSIGNLCQRVEPIIIQIMYAKSEAHNINKLEKLRAIRNFRQDQVKFEPSLNLHRLKSIGKNPRNS